MKVDQQSWSEHAPDVHEGDVHHRPSWSRWIWVIVVATTTWIVWHALDVGAGLAWAAGELAG